MTIDQSGTVTEKQELAMSLSVSVKPANERTAPYPESVGQIDRKLMRHCYTLDRALCEIHRARLRAASFSHGDMAPCSSYCLDKTQTV